jgi:hypothetical protein
MAGHPSLGELADYELNALQQSQVSTEPLDITEEILALDSTQSDLYSEPIRRDHKLWNHILLNEASIAELRALEQALVVHDMHDPTSGLFQPHEEDASFTLPNAIDVHGSAIREAGTPRLSPSSLLTENARST